MNFGRDLTIVAVAAVLRTAELSVVVLNIHFEEGHSRIRNAGAQCHDVGRDKDHMFLDDQGREAALVHPSRDTPHDAKCVSLKLETF